MLTIMATREMTIGYQNRQGRGQGGTGVGWLSADLLTRPLLRISNDYLTKAGFTIGTRVIVHYGNGRILITLKT